MAGTVNRYMHEVALALACDLMSMRLVYGSQKCQVRADTELII